MELSKLYERYGQLMIQSEILTSQIQSVKNEIATAINDQRTDKGKIVEKVETAKKKEQPCKNPTTADSKTK